MIFFAAHKESLPFPDLLRCLEIRQSPLTIQNFLESWWGVGLSFTLERGWGWRPLSASVRGVPAKHGATAATAATPLGYFLSSKSESSWPAGRRPTPLTDRPTRRSFESFRGPHHRRRRRRGARGAVKSRDNSTKKSVRKVMHAASTPNSLNSSGPTSSNITLNDFFKKKN